MLHGGDVKINEDRYMHGSVAVVTPGGRMSGVFQCYITRLQHIFTWSVAERPQTAIWKHGFTAVTQVHFHLFLVRKCARLGMEKDNI